MEQTHSGEATNGNDLKSKATGKAREIGIVAKGRAEERLRDISEKARERAQKQVDEQRERIASRMDDAVSTLKQHSDDGNQLRRQAEQRLAQGMESAAGYLHSHQTSEVAGDIGTYVRQHPIQSVVLALIIGYLLGKILS